MLLLLDLSVPSTLWITISSLQDCTKYSISGIALEWFRSYLTNRSQFALIEGCRYHSLTSSSAVYLKVLSLARFCMCSTQYLPTFYDSVKFNFTFTPMTLNYIFLSLQTRI